jgi:hypothetical protein
MTLDNPQQLTPPPGEPATYSTLLVERQKELIGRTNPIKSNEKAVSTLKEVTSKPATPTPEVVKTDPKTLDKLVGVVTEPAL